MTAMLTLTPDEFIARFAPAADPAPADATPADYFIRNRETGKLELHFDKADYDALTDAQKAEIKGAFLWGRRSGCWISRAKEPNLWRAERVAKSLGLADAGQTGEKLTFAEQLQRKAERAERRAERYEDHADAAAARGEQLQKPITDMHGDIAFFTQPNINTSAGRAFTRRRDRMFAAFEQGFDEYRKSEHYRERAEAARRAAGMPEYKDRGFIDRRIRECEKNIRSLRSSIEDYETDKLPRAEAGTLKHYDGAPYTPEEVAAQIDRWLDQLDTQLDKLGFFQDTLDALGGVAYSRHNIMPGCSVRVGRWGVLKVMSTGPKNFTAATVHGSALQFAYAEIDELVNAEPEPPKQQPFAVGEAFTLRNGSVHTITRATDKTVTFTTDAGNTYRATPKYRPIPASGKWQWVLKVGSTSWASEFIYRD